MKCIKQEEIGLGNAEKRVVIIADSTPSTLPTTGENVDGLDDFTKIATGSILLVLSTSKKYIADETGHFKMWG